MKTSQHRYLHIYHFLYKGSEQSTETGKFFPTFFCRRELLETSVVGQAEIKKDLISHFNLFNFSKLPSLPIMFRIEISKYSFNSESKTVLLTLPVRRDDLPFRFISPSLPVRPQNLPIFDKFSQPKLLIKISI